METRLATSNNEVFHAIADAERLLHYALRDLEGECPWTETEADLYFVGPAEGKGKG